MNKIAFFFYERRRKKTNYFVNEIINSYIDKRKKKFIIKN